MEQGGTGHSDGFTPLETNGPKHKRKNVWRSLSGFTIVETLIVLAVSGALVGSALLLVGGRQNKTEFQTGINNLQQQIQQIINETQSGYYPNNNDFHCKASASDGSIPTFDTGSSSQQGTNDYCIFIGKALRFGGSGGDFQATDFTTYPLVANRTNGSQQQVTCYVGDACPDGVMPDAHVLALSPNSSHLNDYPQNYVATTTLPGGLSLSGIQFGGAWDSNHDDITVFAFLTSLGSYNGDQLNPGAQQLGLYCFPHVTGGTTCTGDNSDTKVKVADEIYQKGVTPLQSVGLCFASGGTNQSGLLNIGDAANGGLGVSVKIFSGTTCGN